MNENLRNIILNTCKLSEGVMELDCTEIERREVYDLFRVSVLDGLIPISKVIGFKHKSAYSFEDVAAIERHQACKENMIELSKNISKLIFLDDTGIFVDTAELIGEVYAYNAELTSNNNTVNVLDKNLYMYTTSEHCGIRFFVARQTGYKLVEENVKFMNNEFSKSFEFFPLNTAHTLLEYVRVLPYMDHKIRYRLTDGIKDSDIEKLWLRFIQDGGK